MLDMASPSDSQQPVILGVTIFLLVLTLIFAFFRVVARTKHGPGLWWDDHFIFIAIAFTIGMDIVAFYDLHEGLGRHQETLTKNELVDFLRGFYFEELFYNIALAFVKVAVLLCYWRIFPTRYMKWTFSALVTIIGLWFTATTLVLILQCRPVRKAWDNQIEGTCYDRRAFFLGQGIPHIVTDAAILISPIYPIWKLNMKLYQKVALSGVFLMGGCAVVFSIVRLHVVYSLPNREPDITWAWVPSYMWTLAEIHLSIISACLACLGPVLKKLKSRISSHDSAVTKRKTNWHTSRRLSQWGQTTWGGAEELKDVPAGQGGRSQLSQSHWGDMGDCYPGLANSRGVASGRPARMMDDLTASNSDITMLRDIETGEERVSRQLV